MMSNYLTAEEKKQLSEIPIVWMLGAPSSGGFTQCKKIVDDYGCTIINTRHLHRENILLNTYLGKIISNTRFNELNSEQKKEIEEIFWNEIVHSLRAVLHFRAMTSNKTEFSWIMIEHYPRSVEQALKFEKEIKSPSLILHLNLEDDVCKERAKGEQINYGGQDDDDKIVDRKLHAYHKYPGKQIIYGGQEYDEKMMDRKLHAYHEYTEPICQDENFRNKCVDIDASKTRELVHRDIRFELSKIGIKKRRPFMDDSAEQYYKKSLLLVGLSAGGLLGVSACGIIAASVLDIIPKEAKNVLTSIAAVTGLLGCSLVGASIYDYVKND